MRYRSSIVLSLALAIAPSVALPLGAGVARADPDPKPEERPLPRSVRLDYLPDPGVRRSCDRAEALALGIANEAKRNPIDPNAAARLIVRITRKGVVYTATVEVRDEEGVTVYTDPFGPVHTCDMLLIDIGVGVGYLFRRADHAAAEKAAAEKAAAEKAADKAAAEKAAAEKAAAEKAAAEKAADKPAAVPPAPRRLALRGVVSGGVGLGVSPADVAGVFNVDGGLQWRFKPDWMFSGALGMRYRASPGAPAEMVQAQVKVATTLAAGQVVPCVHRHIAFLWAFGCTGMEVGRLAAKGTDTTSGRSADAGALWLAFTPRLGVEVPLPLPSSRRVARFAAVAFGDAVVPLLRRSVLVEINSGKTFQAGDTPPVAPAFNLGLLAWFDL